MIIFGKEAKELKETKKLYDELLMKYTLLVGELAKIKPVIETSGWRPAVSDKCNLCDYAYYSDWNPSELLGCCKDVVCSDFKARERK